MIAAIFAMIAGKQIMPDLNRCRRERSMTFAASGQRPDGDEHGNKDGKEA